MVMDHNGLKSGNSHQHTAWALIVVLAAVLLTGCSSKPPQAPTDEGLRAAGVALDCYKALYISQQPEVFLRGRAGTLTDEDREQWVALLKHHLQMVQHQYGGVKAIEFNRAEPDTALNVMQVFLKLTYADNQEEDIVVAMVQEADKWKMK